MISKPFISFIDKYHLHVAEYQLLHDLDKYSEDFGFTSVGKGKIKTLCSLRDKILFGITTTSRSLSYDSHYTELSTTSRTTNPLRYTSTTFQVTGFASDTSPGIV